jgi:hypothetical protein
MRPSARAGRPGQRPGRLPLRRRFQSRRFGSVPAVEEIPERKSVLWRASRRICSSVRTKAVSRAARSKRSSLSCGASFEAPGQRAASTKSRSMGSLLPGELARGHPRQASLSSRLLTFDPSARRHLGHERDRPPPRGWLKAKGLRHPLGGRSYCAASRSFFRRRNRGLGR